MTATAQRELLNDGHLLFVHVKHLAHVYVYARHVPDVLPKCMNLSHPPILISLLSFPVSVFVGWGALQFVQFGRGWYATRATTMRADTRKKRSGSSRPWRSEVRPILRTQKRQMKWVNFARNLETEQKLSADRIDPKNAIRVSTLED